MHSHLFMAPYKFRNSIATWSDKFISLFSCEVICFVGGIFNLLFDSFYLFLSLLRLFLQSPANPDLLYIIFFCHTQLTVTLLLALIFGSKVSFYFVRLLRWLMQTIQLNNLTSECVCVQNYEILRTNILYKLLSW